MFKNYISTRTFFNCKRLLSLKRVEKFDWATQNQILMEPFEYTKKVPNKHLKLMPLAFNQWLQVSEQKIDDIQDALDTMTIYAILVDDIQDSSAYRYGVPSAHSVFGAPLTLNAAYRGLLLSQKQVMGLGHPMIIELVFKVHEQFFLGQGTDMYWRDNFLIPTEQMHIEAAERKTGAWFALPIEILQLFSNSKTDYSMLAHKIGTYYAVLDDYYNLFQPEALATFVEIKHENHMNINDITESKLTMAIIHALQFPDIAGELADILKQRTSDPELISRALSLLKKHGSDQYTKDKLKTMEADIRNQIEQLGGNENLTAIMDDLSIN